MGFVLADSIARRVLPLTASQKSALVMLAFYADEEGCEVFPGDRVLAAGLGSSESHAERMLAQLTKLEWLLDDGWRRHVKVRRIAVERIADYPLVAEWLRECIGEVRAQHDRLASGQT